MKSAVLAKPTLCMGIVKSIPASTHRTAVLLGCATFWIAVIGAVAA